MVLQIALDCLPDDAAQRHAVLREYFCDKDASAVRTPEGWSLTLSWPGDPERHIDPALDVGLKWWGGHIRREEMASAFRRDGRLTRCLYDSWTLVSWARWLERRGPTALESVIILHVDDHRDLGSPRLVDEGSSWRDLISGRNCDLRDPSSVIAAIESGAIGMGSFMAPFLAIAPHAEVRHLCQPPKALRTQDFEIRRVTTPDNLLEPGAPRLGIGLTPVAPGIGRGRYRITPSIDDWLDGVDGRPILLHIDLDYFCNRYDGDSDWAFRSERLDPPPAAIDRQMDDLVKALNLRRVAERIEDVVLAFSPGFFPAELWSRVDESVTRGLKLDGEHKPDRGMTSTVRPRKPRVSAPPKPNNPSTKHGLISAQDIHLVPTKGTKGRGGGPDGEAWRIEYEGRRAGQVFINLIDQPPIGKHASIQIYLNKASQGHGIGRIGYARACAASRYDVIYAHMRKSNMASIRAAMAAGFADETSAKDQQKIMVWRRDSVSTSAKPNEP
ncbi:GNAT family N-acetyltransferase [Pleomorphomonas oryzae]|uniref:GNAT family N-acetyltransferase n=1 Tax=Pleomorphomonas oryzae TaxID=261934 RepID=UPI0004193CF9|nr:GNAT family N-acetyltransferase [Pleomorphomonas oryzae]